MVKACSKATPMGSSEVTEHPETRDADKNQGVQEELKVEDWRLKRNLVETGHATRVRELLCS